MRVLVLGSGVIGVVTAYFLAARGHEVEVVDRCGGSARETSFANGGQLSYSHAEPWANPSVLPKVLKWMFKDDAPLVFRLRPDPHMLSWGLAFLRNCTQSRAHANSVTTLRLGLYSRKKMEQLRTISGIDFDNIREGILHIFTDNREYEAAIRQAHFQAKLGCTENVISAENCIRLEPALEHAGKKVVGGIHAPMDESGDIFTFTEKLAELCTKEFKTVFHYNTQVNSLTERNGRITGVLTSKGNLTADAYVMAMGSYSYSYLRNIGIKTPIYPMKGYSITLPANMYAPKMSITDTEVKLVYSRLGNRLRIAGTAEFAGYDDKVTPHRIKPLIKQVQELFPKLGGEPIHEWACLRPQTPDGPPIIGKTPYQNLFLNTGHGTLGWTHAAGSGVLLADIMEGRETEISLNGLTLDRYQ